jgi:translation initiation factor IF-3
MKKQNRKEKLNKEIKIQKIRLVGAFNGEIVTLKDALIKSEEMGLDLVLISENNDIGVCKIMNYEKFIYEQMKKEKEKPKPLEMKEIKVGPNTDENDLDYRIKHIIEFLERGHKVKITMQFRGREMAYVAKGEALILKLMLAITEHGVAEMMPKLEGKKMFVTLRPLKK